MSQYTEDVISQDIIKLITKGKSLVEAIELWESLYDPNDADDLYVINFFWRPVCEQFKLDCHSHGESQNYLHLFKLGLESVNI
jgi:hypothetical protein